MDNNKKNTKDERKEEYKELEKRIKEVNIFIEKAENLENNVE